MIIADLALEIIAKILALTTKWELDGCAIEMLVDDQPDGEDERLFRGSIAGFQSNGMIFMKVRPAQGGEIAQVAASPRYRVQTALRLRVASLAVNVLQPYPGLVPSRAILRRIGHPQRAFSAGQGSKRGAGSEP